MSPVLMWVLSLFNRACNFCTRDDRFIHRKLYRRSSLHSLCTCDCVSRL